MKKQEKNIEKKWVRNCPNPDYNPDCKVNIYSNSKRYNEIADKEKRLCKSCASKGNRNSQYGRKKYIYPTQLLMKKCPNPEGNSNCKGEIYFKRKSDLNNSIKHNRLCVSCGCYGSHNNMLGKKHKTSSLNKMIEIKKGKNNPMYGRKHTRDTKKKQRLSRIKQIERDRNNGNQISPSYNPTACKAIEKYGKENGYNFKHALNGGEYYISELGYWLDGYDKKRNTVIEFYERSHYNTYNKLNEKTVDRENEIIDFLNCKLIRIHRDLVIEIK